jgi:hypothetical protein
MVNPVKKLKKGYKPRSRLLALSASHKPVINGLPYGVKAAQYQRRREEITPQGEAFFLKG